MLRDSVSAIRPRIRHEMMSLLQRSARPSVLSTAAVPVAVAVAVPLFITALATTIKTTCTAAASSSVLGLIIAGAFPASLALLVSLDPLVGGRDVALIIADTRVLALILPVLAADVDAKLKPDSVITDRSTTGVLLLLAYRSCPVAPVYRPVAVTLALPIAFTPTVGHAVVLADLANLALAAVAVAADADPSAVAVLDADAELVANLDDVVVDLAADILGTALLGAGNDFRSN